MSRFFLIFCSIAVCCCFSACQSEVIPNYEFKPAESDKISPQEQEALVWHARQFVADAKSLRLPPGTQKYVRENNPSIKIRYFEHKYGNIIMEWQINSTTVIHLAGTGHLTDKKFPWNLQVRILSQSHPIPKRMRENLPEEETITVTR